MFGIGPRKSGSVKVKVAAKKVPRDRDKAKSLVPVPGQAIERTGRVDRQLAEMFGIGFRWQKRLIESFLRSPSCRRASLALFLLSSPGAASRTQSALLAVDVDRTPQNVSQ
jgi:hypothetical protein